MKFENFQKAAPYRLFFPILIIASVAFIVYFFVDKSSVKFLWLGLGIISLSIYIYLLLKKPHYFSFEAKYKSFLIRFYNPHPFLTKHQAFEVQIDEFSKYEIKSAMKNIQKYLILYIKKGKNEGSYPPVSISLLNNNQLENLKKELDSILKIKSLK